MTSGRSRRSLTLRALTAFQVVRRHGVLAVAVTLACWSAFCSLAGAQAPRLGLLQLESEDVQEDELAPRLMTELREQLAKRNDYALVDTHVSLHQVSAGQNCNPADASCLQKIADSLQLDGLLFGKVTHEGGAPIAVTRRYDRKSSSIQSWAIVSFESSTVTDAQLKEQTQTLVTTLLGPAPEPQVASAPKPQPAAAQSSSDNAELSASLQEQRPLSSGMSLRTVAGLALIGGAAASVGMSVFSFVQVDHAQHNGNYESYRMAVGQTNANVKDVCDEASAGKRYGLGPDGFKDVKHSCSSGQTFEVLQYVFIGSAILTGGLATYLLVGGKSDTQTDRASARLSLHPAIGKSGASLTARLRF